VNIGQLFADALAHRLQSFKGDLALHPNHATDFAPRTSNTSSTLASPLH
jgi:hypothetical protein